MKTVPLDALQTTLAGLQFRRDYLVRELYDLATKVRVMRAQVATIEPDQLGQFYGAINRVDAERSRLKTTLIAINERIVCALSADSPST